MTTDDCFYLGKISRVVGYKGELAIFIDSDEPEKYSDLKSLFIETGGSLIPYMIEKINARNKNNQFTIKLEDVNSIDNANALCGCDLYLPINWLPPLAGKAFYFHEIEGFTAFDDEHGKLGTIVKVLDYPGNPLFEIEAGFKTILIPVQDQFIAHLDRDNKTIQLNPPAGLVDIYLNEE